MQGYYGRGCSNKISFQERNKEKILVLSDLQVFMRLFVGLHSKIQVSSVTRGSVRENVPRKKDTYIIRDFESSVNTWLNLA